MYLVQSQRRFVRAAFSIASFTAAAGPPGAFSQIATTTGTTYTDGGLTSGATDYYTVKAYDAAGNVSAASNTASATAR